MTDRVLACGLAFVLVLVVFSTPWSSVAATGGAPDRGWGTAAPMVVHEQGDARTPRIAADNAGHALVVWEQAGSHGTSMWANRYTPGAGAGWGVPSKLANEPFYSVGPPDVASDAAGNALSVWVRQTISGTALVSRYFDATGGGQWQPEMVLDSSPLSASTPRVAMSPSGVGFATWVRGPGTPGIYASRFTASTGWDPAPVLLDTDVVGPAITPQIAIDTAGDAIAVWKEYDGARWNIAASRFVAAGAWGAPKLLESSAFTADDPHVASDGNGNAIAVWVQADGTGPHIYVSRFDVAVGTWTAPYALAGGSAVDNPEIASNSAGQMYAVWRQDFGGVWNVLNSLYDLGWMGNCQLSDGTGEVQPPAVAVDTSGDSIAVWRQWDGASWTIIGTKNVLPPLPTGTPCGAPRTHLESAAGDASDPRIAVDGSGNAIATWGQFDGLRDSIYANRLPVSGAWAGGPSLIEHDDAGGANSLKLATNTEGRAVSAWSQDGSLYAEYYDPPTGWSSPARVDTQNPGSTVNPAVAIDGFGFGFVVWSQFDGASYSLYASRGSSGFWSAPILLEAAPGNVYQYDVAADAAGNAMAVWSQFDGTSSPIYASRYAFGSTWSAPATISTPGFAASPKVGFDGSGDAIAVWDQPDGGTTSIYANKWTLTGGWSAVPDLIEADPNQSRIPEIAVSYYGTAVAAWSEFDGTSWNTYGAYYRFVSWDPASAIDSLAGDVTSVRVTIGVNGEATAIWNQWDGVQWSIFSATTTGLTWQPSGSPRASPGDAYLPDVSTSPSGSTIAAWIQWDGTNLNVLASRATGGSRWDLPTVIQSTSGDALTVQARLDGAGNAVVVWTQWDGERYLPWTNGYVVRDGTPTLIVLSPTTGIANNPTVLVSGITDPGATVLIDGLHPTVGPTGGFSQSVVLPEGTHLFQIAAINAANGVTRETRTVTVDMTPPPLTITSPTAPRTRSANVYVAGRTEPGATVVVDGIVANVDATGAFGLVDGLAEGGNSIPVTATDAAGNSKTVSISITVDSVAPTLELTSPTGSLTNNPTVVVAGATEPGAAVTIDGVGVTVDPVGGFNRIVALPEGPHTFDVVSSDLAGNRAEVRFAITIDTQAPSLTLATPIPGTTTNNPVVSVAGTTEPGARVVVNGIVANVGVGGAFALDLVLPDGVTTVSATAIDAAGNAATKGVLVTVDTAGPSLALTAPTSSLTRNPVIVVSGATEPGAGLTIDGAPATVGPTGSFTTTVTLPEGGHTFTIIATDPAGNPTVVRYDVTVDTTPPALSVTAPANGLVTRMSVITISGTTEPGSRITANGAFLEVDAAGAISGQIALAEGQQLVRIGATDPAGNTATVSVTVTVDTAPPALALATPADGAITRSSSVLVSGASDPGTSVAIDGTVVTVAGDGTFSRTVPLPDGEHQFVVVATDPAGNAARTTAKVTVDTLPPAVAITAPTTGATVRDPTVLVEGSAEPGSAVLVNGYGILVGGTGAFSIRVAVPRGTSVITVTATDSAGNTGSDSVTVTFADPLPEVRNDLNTTRTALAGLGTEVLLLIVLVVVVLVVSMVQFVMYTRTRAALRRRGASPEPRDEDAGPPRE